MPRSSYQRAAYLHLQIVGFSEAWKQTRRQSRSPAAFANATPGRSVTLKNLVRSEVRSGVRVRKKCLNRPAAAKRGCCQSAERFMKIVNENLVRGEVRMKYEALNSNQRAVQCGIERFWCALAAYCVPHWPGRLSCGDVWIETIRSSVCGWLDTHELLFVRQQIEIRIFFRKSGKNTP